MRIIITGGTGLIGRSLSFDFVNAGHDVIVLSRNPSSYQEHFPSNVTLRSWDAESPSIWGDLLVDDVAIVNLAGSSIASSRWTDTQKNTIVDSRVKAGRAISEAVRQAKIKPKVLVQSSAVGYYGVQDDNIITEADPAGDDFLSDVCVQWENSTSELESMGTRRVIIRTGVVLDADEGALPRMVLPFRFFVGGSIGDGQQYLPWIHLFDEVKAIRYLIENEDAQGVYNLSAPNPVTNAQFAHILGRVLGKPSIMPTPAFAIRTLFGEMSTVVLDGQRAVPERLLQSGFKFKYEQLEEALDNIL
jgi:uncharacterized protein (TIGR01777 family)